MLMKPYVAYVAVAASSFLIGAVPFSWLLGRWGGIDLRRVGSGNPGATNLYRNLGPRFGVPGLLLDCAKGLAPVIICRWALPPLPGLAVVAAAAAIAGHLWTPFLKFKGGKGVATAAGAFLGLNPLILGIGLTGFGVVLLLSRYVSLGSVVGVLLAAGSAFILPFIRGEGPDWFFAGFTSAMAAAIIFAHRSNLRRIFKGQEGKWGRKPTPAGESRVGE